MTRTDPQPDFDWKEALGVPLPTPEAKPGWAASAHPMTVALLRLPDHHAKAKRVLKAVVKQAEGKLDVVATILGCSWHVAQRLVHAAELREYAGNLRFRHGHKGPTGHGIQPRTAARAPREEAPAPEAPRRRRCSA